MLPHLWIPSMTRYKLLHPLRTLLLNIAVILQVKKDGMFVGVAPAREINVCANNYSPADSSDYCNLISRTG